MKLSYNCWNSKLTVVYVAPSKVELLIKISPILQDDGYVYKYFCVPAPNTNSFMIHFP